MHCFARRGFHQTTMQDICEEASVSVGLIYRYFESKEAVISVIAAEHKHSVQELLARARTAPGLFEALEIFFTCSGPDSPHPVEARFVVDLFAEAGRNPTVATLLRDVTETFIAGVTELIAAAPEGHSAPPAFPPRLAAELIVDTAHGMMMRDITESGDLTADQLQERHLSILRNLWTLLFPATRFTPPAP